MNRVDEVLNGFVDKGIVAHVAMRVGRGDAVLYDTFRGGVDENTLFDMASVTKIIATTSLALIAIDRGLLSVDDSVDKFFATTKKMTVRNLLTHTMGIGHKSLCREGNSDENIAEAILAIPSDIPIGSDVRYSCPGFILLGKILEKIFGKPLNVCFDEMVARPLALKNTSFSPKDRHLAVNANTEEDKRGTVNDYNCRFLGGVAGNAGIFSNLSDVTKYIHCLLKRGAPLIGEGTFDLATRNYTGDLSESRGLGFLYVDGRYAQTGGLFADGAIGHCGHTGQSVFVDCRTGLYVIILSDATVATVRKYGKEHYQEVMDLRARLHSAVNDCLKASEF